MPVASGPTDRLSPSFSGRPKDDHMSHAPGTIEQPPSDMPKEASHNVCQVFRSSALSEFYHAGVEGSISLGGIAVGASQGLNAEVLFNLGTQRAEDPNGEAKLPIKVTILISAWHDMTGDVIRRIGRNLSFLFCSEATLIGSSWTMESVSQDATVSNRLR